MESKERQEKHSECVRIVFSYKPQTWICALKETSAFFYSVLFTVFLSIHSYPCFPGPFFPFSHIWVAACLCVFMQRVPIYSPVYLYFSYPLQGSSLLRQSSIFQIKWSWLKDRANVWFFKYACLSRDSRSDIRFALLFNVVWLWTFITSLLNELLIWPVIKAWLSYVCAFALNNPWAFPFRL